MMKLRPYRLFTDRARKVMQLANEEAMRRQHVYIRTEDILLALAAEGSGVAGTVFRDLDLDLPKIREEVEKLIQPESEFSPKEGELPRAKTIIEYAIDEARKLNHYYVGTEHLLLGLLREEEGAAARVLLNLGLSVEKVRKEIRQLMGSSEEIEPRVQGEIDIQSLPQNVQKVLQTLEDLIRQFHELKEEAVGEMDFYKAAWLRDQYDKLQKIRMEFLCRWSQQS